MLIPSGQGPKFSPAKLAWPHVSVGCDQFAGGLW